MTVRDLTVEFVDGDDVVRPLDGLDLETYDGELVLLLGPSGSGKTTLLSCLAGLLTPTSGSVVALGADVLSMQGSERDCYRRDTVGVVFQAFNLISSLTALENVALPMRLAQVPQSAARRRARELLDRVGLAERTGHRPQQLSGGQQQRVAIARALAMNPPIVLADEPTAHLDVVQVDGVISLLRSLAAPGRTVIVSTHDDRLIPLADRVIELGDVATDSEPVALPVAAGQVIFEQGTRSRDVFVLQQGAVEIYRSGRAGATERLHIIHPGSYFGEMGPLLGLPRSAAARALVDSVVQQYDVRDFRHSLGASERERLRAGEEPEQPLAVTEVEVSTDCECLRCRPASLHPQLQLDGDDRLALTVGERDLR